jgi:hypothetical protein
MSPEMFRAADGMQRSRRDLLPQRAIYTVYDSMI